MLVTLIKSKNIKQVKIKTRSNMATWPKDYTCNFLEPGIVSYEDVNQGVALLKKETIDRMLSSFIGKPVLIDHKEVDPANFKKNAVGYVTSATFNPITGWFDCTFILTDDKAKAKVEEGYSVSCSFDVLETKEGGEWHAIKYDEEISEATFTHLALVSSPRYEECRIRVNSKAAKIKESAMKRWADYAKENGLDIMSPLQRDKYLEGLSDSGIQALIDDPEEDKEIKNLATQHAAMRKQRKEEELLAGKPTGKEKKNMEKKTKYNAADLIIKEGETEVTVAQLIKENRLFVVKNDLEEEVDPALKNDSDKCASCGSKKHDGDCDPDTKKKFQDAKANDDKKDDDDKKNVAIDKAETKLPKSDKKNDDEDPEKDKEVKNAKHFVKLNSLKEKAAENSTVTVDTLHSKIQRGNERYGSAVK
jgi:hypothetical protein